MVERSDATMVATATKREISLGRVLGIAAFWRKPVLPGRTAPIFIEDGADGEPWEGAGNTAPQGNHSNPSQAQMEHPAQASAGGASDAQGCDQKRILTKPLPQSMEFYAN